MTIFKGSSAANILTGSKDSDEIYGLAGDDTLTGGQGDDYVDGGDGNDTAVYFGLVTDYRVGYDATTGIFTIADSFVDRDGIDVVTGVENFSFIKATTTLAEMITLAASTSPDVNPPIVANFSPANGAVGFAVASDIILTFSEAIAKGAGNIVLKSADGATVATYDASTSSNLSISGTTLTINPSADLNYSTGYRVEFAAGTIVDLVGNKYAGSTSYNFSTYSFGDTFNQTFTGTNANESFTGGTGNDTIDGAGGTDTAIYSGKITDYFIKYNRALGTATITDHRVNADGIDSLKSIEKLQFADKTFDLLNLPTSGTPGYGKIPSFLFDAAYYLMSNPTLVPTVTLSTAYDNYIKVGAAKGEAPNTWFDPVYYENRWPDLKVLHYSVETLFRHYNLYGVWEGRSAGPAFDKYDGTRYMKDNPDVAAYVDAHVADFLGSRSNGAIAHYVIYGANEGRAAFDTDGHQIEQAILIGIL